MPGLICKETLQKIHSKLIEKKMMLVTAESCTGGLIAKVVTDMPGASQMFDRGFVTYSNQAKMDLLGVYGATLDAYGAVSEQTAMAMADGALRQGTGQVSVAVTGIAGPDGGSDEKPVGLVYIAVAIKDKSTHVFKHIFQGDRDEIRCQTTTEALRHILDIID